MCLSSPITRERGWLADGAVARRRSAKRATDFLRFTRPTKLLTAFSSAVENSSEKASEDSVSDLGSVAGSCLSGVLSLEADAERVRLVDKS